MNVLVFLVLLLVYDGLLGTDRHRGAGSVYWDWLINIYLINFIHLEDGFIQSNYLFSLVATTDAFTQR